VYAKPFFNQHFSPPFLSMFVFFLPALGVHFDATNIFVALSYVNTTSFLDRFVT
jgi:hypothetical protein